MRDVTPHLHAENIQVFFLMYDDITKSYNVHILFPYIDISFSSACSVLHNHILYEDLYICIS